MASFPWAFMTWFNHFHLKSALLRTSVFLLYVTAPDWHGALLRRTEEYEDIKSVANND